MTVQVSRQSGQDVGVTSLLLCSHGTSSPAGQRAVAGLVEAVARATTTRVSAAFVDVEEPDVATALGALTAAGDGPIVIVPLLLSAGYHVYVDLTEATESEPAARLVGALGPDQRLVDVLVRRLGEAGLAPEDRVVLAAAGSSDERAVRDCERTAALLAETLGREVRIGYLSAAEPALPQAVADARADGRVVVATYLLAPGYFHDLARAAGADVVTDPLLVPDAAPPPELVDVVLDRATYSAV